MNDAVFIKHFAKKVKNLQFDACVAVNPDYFLTFEKLNFLKKSELGTFYICDGVKFKKDKRVTDLKLKIIPATYLKAV